ncbi:MAG: hypothetical protein L0Y66_27645, partial [Myxococcaceae bacterium]|nr:hypothetical protein [Myxococcaceae bacterium]
AYQVLRTLGTLGAYPLKMIAPDLCLREGDPDAVKVETLLGRLTSLLAERGHYTNRFREIDSWGWHEARPSAP